MDYAASELSAIAVARRGKLHGFNQRAASPFQLRRRGRANYVATAHDDQVAGVGYWKATAPSCTAARRTGNQALLVEVPRAHIHPGHIGGA